MMMTKEEAESKGYTVDDCVYPWIAYKGPRFNPIEWFAIYTPCFLPPLNEEK